MPRREEDPSLLGLVISFDPVEEARRYQEEEAQRRKAKKLKLKVKKDDSSKCSGATASTSKSESSPVPDKIVTTIILEESSSKEESSHGKEDRRKELRKSKSESNLKQQRSSSKHKSSKRNNNDLKREKKSKKKQAKKEAKRQKRAARNIQRIARGYLVRRDIKPKTRDAAVKEAEEAKEETSSDARGLVEAQPETTEPTSPPSSTKMRLGARFRQSPQKKQVAAASRLQNAFRLHRVRRLFQTGDKTQWRKALANMFIWHLLLLAPLERMRQKNRLMQGHGVVKVLRAPTDEHGESEDEDLSSSSNSSEEDQDESLQVIPLFNQINKTTTSVVDNKGSSPDLLDAIPEDSSHCDSVGDLLAPLPDFGEEEDDDEAVSVASDELAIGMISPASPSTVTTALTNGSLSPRRLLTIKSNKSHRKLDMHSSCPTLRFDCV